VLTDWLTAPHMQLLSAGQPFYDCEPVDICSISLAVRMNCMLQMSVKAAGWDEASLLQLTITRRSLENETETTNQTRQKLFREFL
jgi:hypothetical protein